MNIFSSQVFAAESVRNLYPFKFVRLEWEFCDSIRQLVCKSQRITKGRNEPAEVTEGTSCCGILGEEFDGWVDSGEMGEAAVFLTAFSKVAKRFKISGMYEPATDVDVSKLEPEIAPCLL